MCVCTRVWKKGQKVSLSLHPWLHFAETVTLILRISHLKLNLIEPNRTELVNDQENFLPYPEGTLSPVVWNREREPKVRWTRERKDWQTEHLKFEWIGQGCSLIRLSSLIRYIKDIQGKETHLNLSVPVWVKFTKHHLWDFLCTFIKTQSKFVNGLGLLDSCLNLYGYG